MNNQGKRPDQFKTSEKIVFFCMVGMIIILAIQGIIDIINSR
jgi:hypothetical protein